MWLDNLKELKKQKGMTVKQIAEETSLPERTVTRIFSGDTNNPYIDTLHRIVTVLGGSLDDILSDTKMVVGEENLAKLKDELDKTELERDFYKAELAVLKQEMAAITAEKKMLQLEVKYKEEIIALHNHYNKMKPAD